MQPGKGMGHNTHAVCSPPPLLAILGGYSQPYHQKYVLLIPHGVHLSGP